MIWAASYCRVSTDREDQAHSFESQQRYFQEYLARKPGWELYAVYADEGVTGTSTRKRAAFLRMMEDARRGKFQWILTKEVSRFSRNILDTISCTRELKGLGVGVLFTADGINTLDPDAELRLSIMASIAQEESRKTSARVKWGQTRRMEQGVVFGRSLLGYRVQNGRIEIEPRGAELVRQIFYRYAVERKGSSAIARELEELGVRTLSGRETWSPGQIIKILKNEKYVGDLVQKKTITPDYLTHAKKYNHGEEPQVFIAGHHEPIISRELWNLAQTERARRNRCGGCRSGCSAGNPFGGKIWCGVCGASFVLRRKKRKDGGIQHYWRCYTAVKGGNKERQSDIPLPACSVGCMLRDDLAQVLFQQTLARIELDRTLFGQTAEELIRAGISRETGAETDIGAGRNEREQAADLAERISGIVCGREFHPVLCRVLLRRIVVYPDHTAEVELEALKQRFQFQLS